MKLLAKVGEGSVVSLLWRPIFWVGHCNFNSRLWPFEEAETLARKLGKDLATFL